MGAAEEAYSLAKVHRPVEEAGMPEEIADRMLDLERYFREKRASRITNDIKQVAARDPRRFAQYAREAAATGAWEVGAEQVPR